METIISRWILIPVINFDKIIFSYIVTEYRSASSPFRLRVLENNRKCITVHSGIEFCIDITTCCLVLNTFISYHFILFHDSPAFFVTFLCLSLSFRVTNMKSALHLAQKRNSSMWPAELFTPYLNIYENECVMRSELCVWFLNALYHSKIY